MGILQFCNRLTFNNNLTITNKISNVFLFEWSTFIVDGDSFLSFKRYVPFAKL